MKIAGYLFVLLLLSLFIACSDDDDVTIEPSDVVLYINEIMPTGSPDWLEIYNPGASDLDISGYYIYDNADEKYQLPQGTGIAAGGYLILYCDNENNGLHTNFKLSSDGETIWLADSNTKLIDEVTYSVIEAENSYGRVTDGASTWVVFVDPTPAVDNTTEIVTNEIPVLSALSILPQAPSANEEVTVSIKITDDILVERAELFYIVNSTTTASVVMSSKDSIYTANIPGFSAETIIDFYVVAYDNGSAAPTAFYPEGAPTNTLSYVVGESSVMSLFINEFMASNDAVLTDENGDYDDWIEIYNAGTEAVDLGGMYITDDLDEITKYQIPIGSSDKTTIAAGGFLIIWADKETDQGVLHVDIKLSADGESIGLSSDGLNFIDSVTFGAQDTNQSTGRNPDGGDTIGILSSITPGASNNQ